MASQGNSVTKVLAEKMRNSCVDSHYTSKYWVRLNPNDATRPIDAPRDDTFFGNVVTRLLLLPIWLPYWFWDRRKKKSEMREFVFAGARRERLRDVIEGEPPEEMPTFVGDVKAERQATSPLADDELLRQLALEWVDLHPAEFFIGARAKIAKLQRTFEKILSENTPEVAMKQRQSLPS